MPLLGRQMIIGIGELHWKVVVHDRVGVIKMRVGGWLLKRCAKLRIGEIIIGKHVSFNY